MPTTSPFPCAHNPLRQLPTVLALPAVRRALQRSQAAPPSTEDELVAWVELDPLAAARALRAATPQVFWDQNTSPSARDIVRELGAPLTRRLFTCEAVERRDTAALLELWHHTIATAHAARELAVRTELCAPDAAYLAGLLHDLPTWLGHLDDSPPDRKRLPTDWVLHWQLPEPVSKLVLDLVVPPPDHGASGPPDLAALVRAAEMLAEFAGFRHPGRAARALESMTRELAPYELDVAASLRDQVESTLAQRGLSTNVTERPPDPRSDGWPADDAAAAADAKATTEELVLDVLGGATQERYRDIRAALTDAAVRSGHYDRAFFANWDAATGALTLRTKQGGSARRMLETRLKAARPEVAQLLQATATQTPALLQAEPNGDGALLRALAVDELLAVPVNGDFERPSFLLLDRSLTLAPFDEATDSTAARALGLSGSLLIQNLLLRRRRQRELLGALTDPLTRLFNRRMGIHALEQAIARTERDRSPLTVLMCDLDHFKQLNDTYGHLQGDAALRATADVLRTMLRRNDNVCRYGGEEFLVMLPDTTPDEATVLATRMFTAVHARGEALELPLSVSIGLTCYRFGDSVESVLLRADRALYASKDYGRNRFSADVDYEDETPTPTAAPQPERER